MDFATSIDVSPVQSNRDRRDFHAIKRQIYRRDPVAVRSLNFQIRFQLDRRTNPFYQHARREDFLCRRRGQVVGRITAIVDDLHNEYCQEQTGFFGFFESIDDAPVAQALLDAASQWLADQGCQRMRGPVNPSMKSDFGVLTEGHQYPPCIMMAHTPRYYVDLLQQSGLVPLRSFVAFSLDENEDRNLYRANWDAYEALCQRIRQRFPEIRVRSADARELETEIRRINELGNQVRASGWGFVPFTTAELDSIVRQLRRVLLPKVTQLAEVGDRLIGYIMAMPDINWALRRSIGPWDWMRIPQVAYWLTRTRRVRIFGLGVDPEYRSAGVAGLLVKSLFDNAAERYPGWELSWVDTENLKSIRTIQRFIPVKAYKTYQLFEKPISNPVP